eukprot:SAG31_NODE_9404_length_1282_cov_12.380389_3_plen_35_part_01
MARWVADTIMDGHGASLAMLRSTLASGGADDREAA